MAVTPSADFDGVDWTDLRKRGLLWAALLDRKHGWILGMPYAEDITAQAIVSIREGQRRWDPSKVTLKKFLNEVIRSMYSNEVAKKKRERLLQSDLAILHPKHQDDIARAIEDREFIRRAAAEMIENHPDLYQFFIAACDNGLYDERPHKEIAAALGMSAGEFSKKRKRFFDIMLPDERRKRKRLQ